MIDKFREAYGVDTVHAWGMTETSPVGSVNNLLAKHLELPIADQRALRTSQGRPPFGAELEIFDADGNAVAHDGSSSLFHCCHATKFQKAFAICQDPKISSKKTK